MSADLPRIFSIPAGASFVDALAQCFAFVVLHRNIKSTVIGFADFVYCANIWVIQCGGRPRLNQKAFFRVRVG